MLSLLLLPPQEEDSSHPSPAPVWVHPVGDSPVQIPPASPFYRMQFFTNFSSLGHFHRVQFCRNRLLHSGDPIGSQVPAASAPAQSSHGVTAPSGSLFFCGILHGCRWILRVPPWASGAQLLHQGLHQGLQVNLSSWHWSSSLPQLHWPGCLQGCSSNTLQCISARHLKFTSWRREGRAAVATAVRQGYQQCLTSCLCPGLWRKFWKSELWIKRKAGRQAAVLVLASPLSSRRC